MLLLFQCSNVGKKHCSDPLWINIHSVPYIVFKYMSVKRKGYRRHLGYIHTLIMLPGFRHTKILTEFADILPAVHV